MNGFIDGAPFAGYERSLFNQFLHLDLGAQSTDSRTAWKLRIDKNAATKPTRTRRART